MKLKTIQTLCQIFEIPPIAFIYPQKLEELHAENENKNNEIYDQLRTYMKLNETGKLKVLEYINDISKIKEYQESEENKQCFPAKE